MLAAFDRNKNPDDKSAVLLDVGTTRFVRRSFSHAAGVCIRMYSCGSVGKVRRPLLDEE